MSFWAPIAAYLMHLRLTQFCGFSQVISHFFLPDHFLCSFPILERSLSTKSKFVSDANSLTFLLGLQGQGKEEHRISHSHLTAINVIFGGAE